MKIIRYHRIYRVFKNKLLHSLFIIFFILFPSLFQLHAQTVSRVVTFNDSITFDEEGGKLFFPSFIMSDPHSKEIYIIDGRSRITVYTSDFFPIYTLGKRDGIETPQGMAIDGKGYLYVTQSASERNPKYRISVYNECLKWERDIYVHGFEGAESFKPYRIAIDKKGNLLVAANYYPGVLYLNNKGRFLDLLAPEKEGAKVQINGVTIDSNGMIYLVSEKESHIYVFDENRTLFMKFGEKGGSSGKLSRPKAVGIDNNNGRMYVVDYMRHSINVYNRKGEYIFEFGGLGWGEGWFQHPSFITVDKEGRIMVADTFNQRVQIFNSW